MRILVPTDFSRSSNNASRYATKMAKGLKAEVVLVHIIYIERPPHPRVQIRVRDIEDNMVDHAKEDCIRLVNVLKSEYGVYKVTYKIIKGYPVEDVIENYSLHNCIDFIIMGTKGATGLKKVLLGSNAAAVISRSSVPVIVVPEHVRYNGIKKIVYASDIAKIEAELKALIKFAKFFGATIHIVHVVPPASNKKIDTHRLENKLKKKFKYSSISVHVILNEDALSGISEYVYSKKADIVAVFAYKHTFFKKLFDKSLTRKMAFQTWIPMISFKK